MGERENPKKPLNVNAYASDNASVNEKDKDYDTVPGNEDVDGKDNSDVKVNASAYSPGDSQKGVMGGEETCPKTPSGTSTDITSFNFVSSEARNKAEFNDVAQDNQPPEDSLSKITVLVSKEWSVLTQEDKALIQRWLSSLSPSRKESIGVIDLDPNLYKMDRIQHIIEDADLIYAADRAESGPTFFADNIDDIEDATEDEFVTKDDVISWWNFRYRDVDSLLSDARKREARGFL